MTGTMDGPDDDLRAAFDELRAHDAGRAPSFEAVLAAARAKACERRPRTPLRAAAAVLVLVASGAALVLLLHRQGTRTAAFSLSEWRSPTAFLLRMPGDAILRRVPAVSESVVNLGAPLSAARAPNE